MILRPGLVPASVTADAICLRCLRKLSRSGRIVRSISSSAQHNVAAVAVRSPRNSFENKYFLANGILREFLRAPRSRNADRNGLTNSVAGVLDTKASAATTSFSAVQNGVFPSGQSQDEFSPPKDGKIPQPRRDDPEPRSTSAAEVSIRPDASSRLSTLSSTLPTRSLRRALATYLSLSKPNLTFLIVLTATASYSLYPVPALLSQSAAAAPSISTLTLLFLTAGTALSSASANALNMLMEPAYDAKMSRTRNRPLVRKLISPRGALLFALVTGAAGVTALYFGVNPTVAFLGGTNIALYAGVYTPLKRISVLNTWVGALVGAIPPLMGWAAAAGQCAGEGATWQELLLSEDSAGGWLLAALLFAWQFPHFNALSWTIKDEYRNAGYKMLAWKNPAMNARVALRYSILMFPVCIGFAVAGVTNWAFVGTSSIINGWMTWKAWDFWRKAGAASSARGLFWASVWHLPIVLVLAMAHKKRLWERIWGELDWPFSRKDEELNNEDEEAWKSFNVDVEDADEEEYEDEEDEDEYDDDDEDDDDEDDDGLRDPVGLPQGIPVPV